MRFNTVKGYNYYLSKMRYLRLVLVLILILGLITGCNKLEKSSSNSNDSSKDVITTEATYSDEEGTLYDGDEYEDEDKLLSSDLKDGREIEDDIELDDGSEDIEEDKVTKVDLIMVGDMLLHDPVHESGKYPDGSYNYDHLFMNVKDIISCSDIAMVNQEVILGGLELGLSGYPTFNGAYEIADSLVNAGFNVILHATNHTLDKGKKGVLNCMNYWKTNYPHIGVVGINESQEASEDIYVFKKDDLRIAILNYTYGTNGVPIPSDMPYILNMLEKARIEKDVKKAREIADFIIVAPHWGTEYMHTPSKEQVELAMFMADLGVDLVIGTHPHVIQPVEWVESENGNRMLIYYSIGNYINSTSSVGDGVTNRMIGAMAKVTIEKHEGEVAYISEYGAIPLISHKDTSGPGRLTVYTADDYSEELAKANEIVKQDKNFSLELCMDIWNEVYENLRLADSE
ncbi:MAG: CapA family protein [Clostridiales bacterium]|nr:CapA family protein [Clostridiales bacterium]